ncbi:MAG: hypothetical protein NVSMB51_19590 [Solirubrobacteraceae bacterium]
MRRRFVALALLLAAMAAVLAVVLSGGEGGRHRPTPTPTPTPTHPAPVPPPAAPSPHASTAPILTGSAAPGPAALAAPPTASFGVNVNRLFNDRSFSAQQIARQLAAVRADGAGIARTDALWEVAEPSPPMSGLHRYDWSFDDATLTALDQHDLTWEPILDYTPVWDASVPGNSHSPPRAADDYASWAAAFAGRYGRNGTWWREHPELPPHPITTYELWNEPDGGFWAPAPDPGRYIDLYLRARNAIKAIDPQARVLVGGLTGAPVFVPALLRARPDARGHIDGVAIHPYAHSPLEVVGRVQAARQALDGAGLPGVPLYVTEFGWVTQPPSSPMYDPPGRRPRDIAATVSALARADCGVAAVLLYTWVTPERDPANQEDWYGVRHPDGAPTAGSAALAGVLRQSASLASAPRLRVCGSG